MAWDGYSWIVATDPPGYGTGPVANGVPVPTTAPTVAMQWTPARPVPCRVEVSCTVVTAATTVTLTATWVDPQAGPQSYTWENATTLSPGVRFELPLLLTAAAGEPVQVVVTAGTANQVYVTGRITPLVAFGAIG